jgi:hypothetical protein
MDRCRGRTWVGLGWARGGWGVRPALMLLAFAFAPACSAPSAVGPLRVPVVLVDLEAAPAKIDPALAAKLTAHLARLLTATDTYRVIPGEELRAAAREAQRSVPRRKRRGAAAAKARACVDLACQANVGRTLGAVAAVVTRVERNLVGQCDVFGELRDLRRVTVTDKARARSGCSEEEIKDSLHHVLCHVLAQRTAHQRDAGPSAAPDPVEIADCLARAEFHWAEQSLEAFRRAPVERSAARLAEQEQRMGEQVLALKRRYDGVGQHRRNRWTVAAQCRTGAIYEAFAARLLDSYRAEGAAASSAPQSSATREKTRPLEDKAREIYAACVKRGDQLKVSCPEIEEARRRASSR